MAGRRLSDLINLHRVKAIVPTNGYEFIEFGEYCGGAKRYCLGTWDLNSCHAVAIVSQSAAILAHISPRPFTSTPDQTNTSDAWIQYKVNQILQLFTLKRNDFQNPGSSGIVIHGIYNGESILQHQVAIMSNAIYNIIGSAPRVFGYNLSEGGHQSIDGGVVLIEGNEYPLPPSLWIAEQHYTQTAAGWTPTSFMPPLPSTS